jgi:hypothetical protein
VITEYCLNFVLIRDPFEEKVCPRVFV